MNKVIFQRQLFPVIKKGQVMSNYYRLMNRQGGQRYCCYQLDLDQSEHISWLWKSGGYTWMQICATLVCNTKNSDEQSIICVNYVLRYIADYHTNHHNHNHNRHHNCKNPNHRHDINHHLNINFVLSGSQYSSVVMASEQVRISIFSTYDNEKEGNASTKSWGNYNFADQLLSTIS